MLEEKTEIIIRNLQIACRVGVPALERQTAQLIYIDIVCELENPIIQKDNIRSSVDYDALVSHVRSMLSSHTFILLETLVAAIAKTCFEDTLTARVRVSAYKPHKLTNCEAVGVKRTFRRC